MDHWGKCKAASGEGVFSSSLNGDEWEGVLFAWFPALVH